jgi:diguanylate cyclase (GGDEF)-like protein
VQKRSAPDRRTRRARSLGRTSLLAPVALALLVGGYALFGEGGAAAAAAGGIGLIVGRAWALDTAAGRRVAAARAELEALGMKDPLTELLNHRAFQDGLGTELRRARRDETKVAVVALDIDDFADLNRRLGHRWGDRALRAVADALRDNLRPGDVYGRVGGDEFMLALGACEAAGAHDVVQRLSAAISASSAAAEAGGLTVSVGIAEFPRHALDQTDLMRLAEGAMYWSKSNGPGSCTVYTPRRDSALNAEEETARLRRSGLFNTVHALAKAVDARDAYTHMHSQRVAFYASTLATSLGLPEERVEGVRLAGLLHDVGKIGIRDAILLKAGRLTEEEYAVMRRKSELGRDIIAGAGMPDLAHWVCHLHERMDGRGYPDGLAGEEIPLESRILHVADALEAMTCPRIYRKPLRVDDALDEIESHAGTQFDADVASELVRLVRAGEVEVGEQPRRRSTEPPAQSSLTA